MMPEQNYNVLFLCTGNSVRSILAEAILRKDNSDHFTAYSAGSHPHGAVHPYALDLLNGMDMDTSFARSNSWDERVWPGTPMTAHWGVPDPTVTTGTEAEIRQAFANAYRMLNTRISLFTNLPLASIDRVSLKTRLTDICKS